MVKTDIDLSQLKLPHNAGLNDGNLGMFSGGSLSTLVKTTEGPYVLQLEARADLFRGKGPIVDVTVNGRSEGQLEVVSTTFKTYDLKISHLRAGTHEIVIHFTNDQYDEATKEDRNLYLKRITYWRQ